MVYLSNTKSEEATEGLKKTSVEQPSTSTRGGKKSGGNDLQPFNNSRVSVALIHAEYKKQAEACGP